MTIAAAFTGDVLPGISPDVYGAADFEAIAEIVYGMSGNVLPPGKAMLVYSRIAPLVREGGFGTFAAFIDHIRRDSSDMARAVTALTTNHTFFFREAHHFQHLAKVVRPRILAKLNAGERVRIWSAGCSSGEETWSLVMTLLGEDRGLGKHIAARNIRILASDIAPHALKKAMAARYEADDLKAVPGELRKHWTVQQGRTVEIGPEARKIVRFRTLNLLGDWPFKGRFDVIFCRNVMIYFDQPTKEQLVSRFAERLLPESFLYIGHSERATGPGQALLESVGPTIYRRSAP